MRRPIVAPRRNITTYTRVISSILIVVAFARTTIGLHGAGHWSLNFLRCYTLLRCQRGLRCWYERRLDECARCCRLDSDRCSPPLAMRIKRIGAVTTLARALATETKLVQRPVNKSLAMAIEQSALVVVRATFGEGHSWCIAVCNMHTLCAFALRARSR